jgi:hypothetical protein
MWLAEFKTRNGALQTREFHSKFDLDVFVKGLHVCGKKAKVSFQN